MKENVIITRSAYYKLVIVFSLFLWTSCGQLQFDITKAYPLVTVSISQTPSFEDVRSFVQYDDLIYTAAGSGGILVYRIVGDSIDAIPELSLTNLYSEELEQVYVRTVEIISTHQATNLIFAYDTLSGGGVGIAEISSMSTKPLGSLQTEPGLRIRKTISSYNPQGIYHVLVADEGTGVLSYDISFSSNSYFEQEKIASLVDYISLNDIERPAQAYSALVAPGLQQITNKSQITNLQNLIELALNNPTMFATVISNIPFLPIEQRTQLANLVGSDPTSVSNVLNFAQNIVGEDVINQLLLSNASNLLSPTVGPNIVNTLASNINPNDIQNILSLSGLQNLVANNTSNILEVTNNLFTSLATNQETETLFEEIALSNLNLAGEIDTSLIHDTNYNPFINRGVIGNAGIEIQETIDAVGRRFFVEDDETLKYLLQELDPEELFSLFSALFEQTSSAITLIPIIERSGLNIRELYQLWLDQDYLAIIDQLDATLIAELLRQLPRYQIESTMVLMQTNSYTPNIRYMVADENTLYLAAGEDGALVIDKVSGETISSLKRKFSEVTMFIPYTVYNKNYYVLTDKLDGLTIFKQEKDKSIGKQIARIGLVGETYSVFPYEELLWVADGTDGVLGVRFNKDETLAIEAELYQKQGIAYNIGTARRREVLASYGAEGLKRLRITNVLPEGTGYSTLDPSSATKKVEAVEQEDFVAKSLEWGLGSPIAQFLRKIFFL